MKRIAALDGLRGLAIILVVAGHSYIEQMPTGGMIGVTLFFVLSGFLITRILQDRPLLSSFYLRRAKRLLPGLAIYLIVTGLFLGWQVVWPALTYTTNYAGIAGVDLGPNNHLWSLAVEEHFYLIWPLLLLIVRNVKPVLVATVIGSAVWRLVVSDDAWAYASTDTNLFAIGLGCLLALTWARLEPHRLLLPGAAIALMVLSFYPATTADQLFDIGRWLPLVAAPIAGVGIWASCYHSSRLLEAKPLVLAGTVSYGWYLWHLPIVMLTKFYAPHLLPAAIAFSFLIAMVIWHKVERPILQARNRSIGVERPDVLDESDGSEDSHAARETKFLLKTRQMTTVVSLGRSGTPHDLAEASPGPVEPVGD